MREPGLFTKTIEFLQDAEIFARETCKLPETLLPAYGQHVLMILSQAYAQLFATRAQNPDLVPHTGALFPWGAPNPDTIYAFAPVDPHGVYRLSGRKGSESVASVMLRRGGANTGQVHGAPLDEIDLRTLDADAAGAFSFLLSQARPAGYTDAWFALHPETTGLVTRRVVSTASQRDGTCTITRLDKLAAPDNAAAADIAERTETMLRFAQALNEFLLRYVAALREKGVINRLEPEKFKDNGGLRDQLYYQGLFEIAADEALILTSELPAHPHYWSVQLMNPFYSAIEFVTRQSSLNGAQAVLDSDGKARFVLCAQDPGVPNWLDSGGWLQGGMMWRWHADNFPHPTVQKVKLEDLRRVLPPDTPAMSAEQRQAALGARADFFQSRRRW